jgi:hypothetical protein
MDSEKEQRDFPILRRYAHAGYAHIDFRPLMCLPSLPPPSPPSHPLPLICFTPMNFACLWTGPAGLPEIGLHGCLRRQLPAIMHQHQTVAVPVFFIEPWKKKCRNI